MVIQIDQELCTGCGICVESCSIGAIQVVKQRGVIDDLLCTRCGVCIDACPNRAIIALSVPARITPIVTLPVTESRMVSATNQAALPEMITPARGLVPLAGAALAFLGREVAPRLADVLVAALERRLACSPVPTIIPASLSSQKPAAMSRRERRQARYGRGGSLHRKGNRNQKERR